MESARAWASQSGFEYRFYDDHLFDFCPTWYREKSGGSILLMSDLARLGAARELLAEGFDRTIWIDADLVVFDPTFRVDIYEPFAFCRELWVQLKDRVLNCWPRVNNAVCTFARGNTFLDFYIDACQSIVRAASEANSLAVGTTFLTGMSKLMPIPLIESVATLPPQVMQPLAQGNDAMLEEYRRLFGRPIRAANLCGSLCDKACQGIVLREADYERAIDWLLASGSDLSDHGNRKAE
jgi:hypothetical protein